MADKILEQSYSYPLPSFADALAELLELRDIHSREVFFVERIASGSCTAKCLSVTLTELVCAIGKRGIEQPLTLIIAQLRSADGR